MTVLGELIVSKFQSKKQIIVGKEGDDLDMPLYGSRGEIIQARCHD